MDQQHTESGEEVQQLMAWIQAQTSQSHQWLQALASFPITEKLPETEIKPLVHEGSSMTLVDYSLERPPVVRQDSIVSTGSSNIETSVIPGKRHQVKRACGKFFVV
jgi:hypothetical protein